MKIKQVLLVALTALVLSLAAIGVTAPAVAGGRGGISGDCGAGPGCEMAGAPAAVIAGRKPGVGVGSGGSQGSAGLDARMVAAPETIAGGLNGGVVGS
jgi:hypothetical protein